MAVSWKPIPNPTFDVGTFLLFTLPKSIRLRAGKHGVDSYNPFWKLTVLLFNALYHGVHPKLDHNSKE
eukprot:9631666-Alexandrium_andersonii.AAC.1